MEMMQTQSAGRVRPPAVAGLFYAADAAILRRDVRALLNAAKEAGAELAPQPSDYEPRP